MNDQTIEELRGINRVFYERFGGDFDAHRTHPWPGWSRVLQRLQEESSPLRDVLDVGAGNGRLYEFLKATSFGEDISYLGLDFSSSLLSRARARTLSDERASMIDVDILEPTALDEALSARDFDLIALFGVLHHIPGNAVRAALVEGLARRLRKGGHLVLTLWRFETSERMRKKIRPWSLRPNIDPKELENGDHLLSFSTDAEALRYCHHVDGEEERSLVSRSGLALSDAFDADGKEGALNRYLLLRRA